MIIKNSWTKGMLTLTEAETEDDKKIVCMGLCGDVQTELLSVSVLNSVSVFLSDKTFKASLYS